MKMTKRGWLLAAFAAAHMFGMVPLAVGQLANEPLAQAAPGKGEAMLGSMNSGATSVAATGFEENKGQVKTTEGQPAPFVRYRLTKGSTSIFLLESGIAYQFERVHQPAGYAELVEEAHRHPEKHDEMEALNAQVRRETYRMDMVLEGADPNSRITSEGQSSDYTNYYNHDALDVHHYSRVTYHDVYPGIDWVVYTTEKGMKYDFVVHPGADPAHIVLRFKDHEELYVDTEGNLIHGNRLGQFTEQRPVSFQERVEVATRFVLKGTALSFDLGRYDRNSLLTIDPARIWGTYYGGVDADFGFACSVDGSGNHYLAGLAGSAAAIATGGHQNTFGGVQDAFLVKFNSNGARLWGTYYGGAGDDYGLACPTDGSGNVYLSGSTYSSTSIASVGHQNTIAGGPDAFLVKFNPNGVRLWGTYYGGSGDDQGYACSVDGSGNVYLGGYTSSTTGIASGGHQNTYGGGGGGYDAFLVKFDLNGVRQWGTYYGGGGYDQGLACALDPSGNVFLAGLTSSTSAIALNGHQNTIAAGRDAFLVKFNSSGVRQWGSYYGGGLNDEGYACSVDGSGNVYLAGLTNSSTAIASVGHQNTIAGGRDAFLVKFNSNGARLWGTYYGGAGDDEGYACSVDGSGNVYLSGQTNSTNSIAANGHQNSVGGGEDAFLVAMSSSGVRQWGTYYGGASADQGNASAVDGNGNICLAGQTTSVAAISSDGHQNTYGGGLWDAFLVKFQSVDPSLSTGTINGAPFCSGSALGIPYTASSSFNSGNIFTAQLSNASGSFASPVNIGNVTATVSGAIVGTIPLNTPTGTGYRIRVTGSNPSVVGTDNGVNITVTAATLYYADADGDTYGNPVVTQPSCTGAPQGYVSNANDCNDASPTSFIGAPCNDGNPNTVNDALNTICQCVGSVPVVRVFVKAILEGPAIPGQASMQDQLRAGGYLPLAEPYTALGYAFVTGGGESTTSGALATTGNNAIVDWVLLELRSSGSPSTRVATRAALIQRDGDVVDVDGVSSVAFNAAPGSYYVALRHRNHLGVMTATSVALSSTPTAIDFTSAATGTYGTNARKDVFGSQLLWSGDVNFNGELKYTGSGNDRDPILVAIGSTLPNNTINGYRREDTNMDGVVRYTGTANDRDPILVNVGSTTPNAVRVQQLP